ncbi:MULTISPECIES: FeoA family protein [Clostridiaceae]|uniref:Ferrous iron transport protein A n=1 Tax=Clostridium facile TaxID=2763035 RepID=A0ABR7IMY6_9CLOT|nr:MULTISPECIES: FeoA family protein [Clostridiaceae]MBC5786493.1 ferrous iron transport protein A [Clostridium facile]PWN00611.1 MAG: ferrous iron transport protein A [Massilioclostridium sp.]
MMPLTMVEPGKPISIQRIGGKEEIKRFLENLGFVVGSDVTIISKIGGNVIVNIKNSRVAISKEMANKIMV